MTSWTDEKGRRLLIVIKARQKHQKDSRLRDKQHHERRKGHARFLVGFQVGYVGRHEI